MPGQLDLGAFLAQQSAQGTVLDEGDFTVSHQQAARKLAKFALPRSTAWVSKLVQAAVRWQCGAIQVRQSRHETLFHLTLPSLDLLPSEDAIVNGLLSSRIGGRDALDALSLALRALVEQAKLSFILVVDDGEMVPRPIYSGVYYGEISEAERLSKRYSPKVGLSLTVYHHAHKSGPKELVDYLPGQRGGVAIVRELDQFCYMSPVPILVDGRRVDGLLGAPVFKFSETHKPLVCGGVNGLAHSPDRLPLPLAFEEKTLSLLSHQRRALRSCGGAKEFSAAVLLSFQIPGDGILSTSFARRRSELRWLNDGVVVEREILPFETQDFRVCVFANAAGLSTDLTGFTPLDNEERAARRKDILMAVGVYLRQRTKPLDPFFQPDFDAHSSEDAKFDDLLAFRRRLKILLRGSGTGLALTLVNPLVGVPTTLGAIVSAYLPKSKDRAEMILDQRNHLETRMRSDRNSLVNGLTTIVAESSSESEQAPLNFDDERETDDQS